VARIVVPSPEMIEEATDRLRAGRLVAFPTETVYGLGADLFNEAAIDLIFERKGRPFDNPLIAHVLDPAGARHLSEGWDARCETLASRFWPGPLTFVLPRAECVPPRATAGLETIAIRAPRHDVARALLEAFGAPISAPSANRSGHVSPTSATHVAADFADDDEFMILDGGSCEVGLESTVLDLTTDPPRILRPGEVTERELREILGDVAIAAVRAQAASPGTSPRHYAPRTPAVLIESAQLFEHLGSLTEPAAVLCFNASIIIPPHRPIEMPQGAGEYARVMYDALRRADATGLSRIVIEAPPLTNDIWRAIHDRLNRATATGR
jgi:L-threonylcarbamoyladenylate synthase